VVKKLLSLALLGAVLIGAVQALPPNSVAPWGFPLNTTEWGQGYTLSHPKDGFAETNAERDAFDDELTSTESTIDSCDTLEFVWNEKRLECLAALDDPKFDVGAGPSFKDGFLDELPTEIDRTKTLQVQSTIYGTNDWEVAFLTAADYAMTAADWRDRINNCSGITWEIIYTSELHDLLRHEKVDYYQPYFAEFRGYRNALKEFDWMVSQYYVLLEERIAELEALLAEIEAWTDS
jgi:hypothetical protein